MSGVKNLVAVSNKGMKPITNEAIKAKGTKGSKKK